MTIQGHDPKCRTGCWVAAAVAGLFIFIMLSSIAGKSFMAALVLGLIGFALLGLLFNWLFCAPVPEAGKSAPVKASGAAGSSVTSGAAKPAATRAAPAVAAPSAAASSAAAPSAAPARPEESSTPAEDASEATTATAAKATSVSSVSASSAAPAPVEIKPSTPLSGEAELATRKGAYKYDAAAGAQVEAASAGTDADAGSEPAKAGKGKGKAGGKGKGAGKGKAKAADPGIAVTGEPAAKAGKGKGAGKVKGQGTAAAKRKADRRAARTAEAAATPDFDGDGVREGTDEGAKPALLGAARDGGADDLKRIKGIGPKLEKACNEIGVFHFDQIAAWTADEVAWVNANLIGFKGRVTRDSWVEQAKTLAAGGETEFSQRVDKGSVY